MASLIFLCNSQTGRGLLQMLFLHPAGFAFSRFLRFLQFAVLRGRKHQVCASSWDGFLKSPIMCSFFGQLNSPIGSHLSSPKQSRVACNTLYSMSNKFPPPCWFIVVAYLHTVNFQLTSSVVKKIEIVTIPFPYYGRPESDPTSLISQKQNNMFKVRLSFWNTQTKPTEPVKRHDEQDNEPKRKGHDLSGNVGCPSFEASTSRSWAS